MDELQAELAWFKEHGLGERRPWAEFFEVFKPPSNWKADTLERRMATNLMHYRANYACVLLGALGLAIVLSPATIFALLVSAALCAYLFGFCKTPALVIGELKLPLTRRNKAALAGGGSVVVLGLSGALVWMLWMLSLGVAAVLSHMLFRPRSVKSRYNAVKEDLRLRDVLFAPFDAAAAADGAKGDDMEGGAVREERATLRHRGQ